MALISKDLFGNISINGLSDEQARELLTALREAMSTRRNSGRPLNEIVARIAHELDNKIK